MAATLPAQDYRAKLTGEVLDASGAPTPKVRVELTNKASMVTVSTVSNQAGVYLFQFLDSGEYRLTAASPGFKTFAQDGLRLQAGQSTGIDIILQVGDTSERIDVTAEIAALDTESASRGLVASQQSLRELPVRSQNPLNLVNMLPGTTQRTAGVFMAPFANSANVNFVISGGSPQQNEMLVDGAPNTARTSGVQNNIALMPVQESVGEVTVITNAYDASYGRTSGGVVNFTTLGGGKEHHLTGWSFFRRKEWNANAYPLNAIGSPRAEQSINQWGFQAAGPVEIPKLLRKNAKYALFYLASYENYLELFPQPIRVGLPTAEMRTGDFSRLKNATGDGPHPRSARAALFGESRADAVSGQCDPAVQNRPGGGCRDEVLPGSERSRFAEPTVRRWQLQPAAVLLRFQFLELEQPPRREARRQQPDVLPLFEQQAHTRKDTERDSRQARRAGLQSISAPQSCLYDRLGAGVESDGDLERARELCALRGGQRRGRQSQLRPYVARLAGLADQATGVSELLRDLGIDGLQPARFQSRF